MNIKIKVCGVTNYEDAAWAVNLGASYIGFNFWEGSVRKVSEKNAREIITQLPQFVATVGVFVDADPAYIRTIVRKTSIQYVQLHGNEDSAYVEQLKQEGLKIIKVFHVRENFDVDLCASFKENTDFFLLDTQHDELPGGTGQTFNWDIALKIKEITNKPFFLAGGLSPDNVAEAVQKVLPFGVDVSSGIEKSPRRKDYDKMKAFIIHAQEAL